MGYSREDRQSQRVQGVQSLHVHPVREGGPEGVRPRCLSALFPPASPAPLWPSLASCIVTPREKASERSFRKFGPK